MKLYPYQDKIFQESLKAFESGDRQMIVVPTGGGKTVIFSSIIKHLGAKALIVAHTREIINQCKNTLNKMGVKGCRVQTIQWTAQYQKDFSDYDMLVIDECHRAGSSSYLGLIEMFKGKKVLGVTATPFRNDGTSVRKIFEKEINCMSLIDMIKEGHLCDFMGFRVKTDISLKGIRKNSYNNDFNCRQLTATINVKNRNNIIVDKYKEIAPDEKAICFAASVDHAKELARTFREKGVPSECISSLLTKEQRQKLVHQFKLGHIKVLVNCQVLTEGFDEPSVTCILLARPTCSNILYLQMIGRGSRRYLDKEFCKIIEFTDNEFEVSCIEGILDSRASLKMKNGELLSKFAGNLERILKEGGDSVVQKMELKNEKTWNPIYEKKATQWQLIYLRSKKLEVSPNLTEVEANKMILEAT